MSCSLFAQANSDEMLLDDDTILLNPVANTPLKIYTTDMEMLGSEESLGSLPLRLTSAEKAIIHMPGTVLVLGRSVCTRTDSQSYVESAHSSREI